MLTVTYVGTDHHNPGDTITDIGVRALIDAAYGRHHTVSVMLRDEVDVRPYRLPPSDVLVVSGTPWFWHRAADSAKYAALRHVLEQDTSSLRILFGGGSCYLFGQEPTPEDVAAVREVFASFDACICRDALAHAIARQALGERARFLPCPSMHAATALGVEAEPERDILLVYLAVDRCFNSRYLPADVRDAILDLQRGLVEQGVDVLCMTDDDEGGFRERFGAPTWSSRVPREIVDVLASYRQVVAGRVHGAMPALSLGIPTAVIPIDSRVLTTTAAGARVCDVGRSLAWGGDLWRHQAAQVDVVEVLRELAAAPAESCR